MVEQGHDIDTDARVDDSAAPVEQAPAGATTLADRLLDGAGTGILAHDHQGVVRFLNASVRVLLPDQRVGELLVGALDPRAGRSRAGAPTRWSSPSPAAGCARTAETCPTAGPPGTSTT